MVVVLLGGLLLAPGCEPQRPLSTAPATQEVEQPAENTQETAQAPAIEAPPAADPALLLRDQEASRELKEGNPQRARGIWREILLQDRTNLAALEGVARSFMAEDRLEDAMRAYEEALRHHPDALDAQIELARLYKRMDRREAALRLFKALGERAPTDPALLGMYGTELLEQGLHREAVEVLERALALNAESVELKQNLANAYQHTGLSQRALVIYQDLLDRNPEDADVRFNLGVVQEKEGSYEDALRSWERVLAERPDHAPAKENLARLKLWLAKKDK